MGKTEESKSGGIDPAALAAASLAAAVSVLASAGPYAPGSMFIGVTILSLIITYDVDPHRSAGQSFAFSAVAGMITALMLGYPLECVFAKDSCARLCVLLHEKPKDLPYSEVPPIATIILWGGATGLFYLMDGKNRNNSEPKPDTR
jgi:hypothetical protein